MKYLGAVGALIVLSQTSAFAALNAYLTLKGQKQGMIKGNTSEKTKVYSFSFGAAMRADEINSKREVTGHRKWSPVVVRIETGAVSQPLQLAVSNSELMDIDLVENKTGAAHSEVAFHAHFYDAVITHVRFIKSNASDAHEMEEVTFTFRKIEWTYGSGKTNTDSWDVK